MLIVEDDAGVRQALERGLARGGFDTIAVAQWRRGVVRRRPRHRPGRPRTSRRRRRRTVPELRARHPERPIIVVTGRDDELDVVDALDAGADDYVTKPFSLAVLTARIRRHLDRSSAVTVIGALRIDRVARRAQLAGEPIELTVREFDLLAALANRSRRDGRQGRLDRTVWDAHWSKSTHTLDVHISALRAKLRSPHVEAPTIITVPELGYRLDAVPSNR